MTQIDLSHVSASTDVYPIMPDTRFFMDVLRSEDLGRPALVVDVGCGAAPLAAVLAQKLGSTAASVAADISLSAVRVAAETGRRNGVSLHVARMDLMAALRPGLVDLLAFHSPYVPTTAVALAEGHARAAAGESSATIEAASWTWAGGPFGLAVLQRLLEALPVQLAPGGVAYVLFHSPELPDLKALGLSATVVASNETKAERHYVIRVQRGTQES